MRFKITKRGLNYFIGEFQKQPCIMCLKCGCTSFHPKDIEYKFCGFCNEFLEDKIVENSSNNLKVKI